MCTCPSGYTGVTCQYTSSCANSPCKNGGTCIDRTATGGTFSCQCPGKQFCFEINNKSVRKNELKWLKDNYRCL